MPPSPPTHNTSGWRMSLPASPALSWFPARTLLPAADLMPSPSVSAFKTARAGYTPPPVPPAQINNRPVRPSFLFHILYRHAGYIHHDPHRGDGHHQVGAARADKRQCIPGKWQQCQHYRHVNEGFDDSPEAQTSHHQRPEPIWSPPGNSHAAPENHGVQTHQHRRADNASFFANHRKDAVG